MHYRHVRGRVPIANPIPHTFIYSQRSVCKLRRTSRQGMNERTNKQTNERFNSFNLPPLLNNPTSLYWDAPTKDPSCSTVTVIIQQSQEYLSTSFFQSSRQKFLTLHQTSHSKITKEWTFSFPSRCLHHSGRQALRRGVCALSEDGNERGRDWFHQVGLWNWRWRHRIVGIVFPFLKQRIKDTWEVAMYSVFVRRFRCLVVWID